MNKSLLKEFLMKLVVCSRMVRIQITIR